MAWPEISATKQQAAPAAIRNRDMMDLAESEVTPLIQSLSFCPKIAMFINLTAAFLAQKIARFDAAETSFQKKLAVVSFSAAAP